MNGLADYYELGGRWVELTAESEALRAQFERGFGSFKRSKPEDLDQLFRLDLCEGPLPTPAAGVSLIYEGPVLLEGECQLLQSAQDETLLLFHDKAALQIWPQRAEARITLLPGYERYLFGTIGITAIEAIGYAAGWSMLHVAALTLPNDGRMLLIHAPSGVGKTTTSLALMRQGFGLVSDDVAFVRSQENDLAFGMPRALKVHRNTLTMMPWLEPLLEGEWSDEDEKRLPRENLHTIGAVEGPQPRPLAAIVRLSRCTGSSQLTPIQRTEMVASLAADNVRTGRTGLLPIQQHRLAQVVKLVSRVPVFELSAGRDLESLGGLLKEHILPDQGYG